MVGRELPSYQRPFDSRTELMDSPRAAAVIATVHGIATAAGRQLVAACDLTVAADDARFATPSVKIGPLLLDTDRPAFTCHRAQAHTCDAAYGRTHLRGPRHLRGGSSTASCRPRSLTAVDELVGTIARSSPLTVGIGKHASYEQVELDEHRAHDLTKSVMTMNAIAADAQQEICAFLERPPNWTGGQQRPRPNSSRPTISARSEPIDLQEIRHWSQRDSKP